MRLKSKKSNIKKQFIAASIVLLLLIVGTVAYWYYQQKGSELSQETSISQNNIDYSEATDDQKSAGTDIKERVATDQPNTQTSSSTSITITSSDKTADTLYIRSIIQKITDSGSCSLSMTNSSGKTYTAESQVQAMASTSTCKGFDVPIAKLSSGTWTISIQFKDDISSGSTTQEITI